MNVSRIIAVLVAPVLTIGLVATVALAQTPQESGAFKAWSAFTWVEGGKTICYAVSEPEEKLPRNVKHGEVYFLVTKYAGQDRPGEPSFQAGYTFKAGSELTAEVGSSKFKLFTKDNGAWVEETQTETRLLDAMKRGSTMRVKGISARGTATEYRISLSGVTAAIDKINADCK